MSQFPSINHTDYSNEDLVNTLIMGKHIHTINVEKVFRSVDRGFYCTIDDKLNPYRHSDWQSGDVHLSAPKVYATALECLDLDKGQKFLNIGSGIGYFSTLAGLLLGVNGVNHGIEINGSLIDIAYQKLEEFKQTSAAIDYFDFCEPLFIEGNAYELLSEGYYDRVYCGAVVPPAKHSFLSNLIKIGGVIIMPLGSFLVKAIKQSIDGSNKEYEWKVIEVLKVSFADLVVPEKCSSMKVVKFPTVKPLSLKRLCRSKIRASIRNCLYESHPDLQMRTICKATISVDRQFFGPDYKSSPYVVPARYRATDREMIPIQNIVNTISDLDETISNLGSTSGNEAVEEDNDYNNGGDDDDDVEEKNTSEQCHKSLLKKTESDTKGKSSEAGCSEENKILPEKPEDTKRMRMNSSSSTVTNVLNSQSTNSSSDLSEPHDDDDDDEADDDEADDDEDDDDDDDDDDYDDDSNSWVSFEENNQYYDDCSVFLNSGEYDYYRISNSQIARGLILYCSLDERKENELSKLLKGKIDLLPVSMNLKLFLNYNKRD